MVHAVRAVHARTSDRVAQNGCFTDTCRCKFTADYAGPTPDDVPLTSIYSKGDGVVRWRAAIVPYARCVEVTGSHVGLAFNRKVYAEVARTLARDAGLTQARAPTSSASAGSVRPSAATASSQMTPRSSASATIWRAMTSIWISFAPS